jgi:hypothetical protein
MHRAHINYDLTKGEFVKIIVEQTIMARPKRFELLTPRFVD